MPIDRTCHKAVFNHKPVYVRVDFSNTNSISEKHEKYRVAYANASIAPA